MSTAADDNPAQDALIAQLAAFRESTEVETLEACSKLRELSANDTSARLRMERISSAAIVSNFLQVGSYAVDFPEQSKLDNSHSKVSSSFFNTPDYACVFAKFSNARAVLQPLEYLCRV